ncbi:MAG: hypothetical protein ACRDY0_11605 [Acidimicrobiales bacterium]
MPGGEVPGVRLGDRRVGDRRVGDRRVGDRRVGDRRVGVAGLGIAGLGIAGLGIAGTCCLVLLAAGNPRCHGKTVLLAADGPRFQACWRPAGPESASVPGGGLQAAGEPLLAPQFWTFSTVWTFSTP